MKRRVLYSGLAAGLMAAVAPFLPAYPLTVLTQALIAAMLAMSLDLLLGYTGLPSLGHAAYFGAGAYAVAILATERQVGFAGCLVAGIVVATIAAALFGVLAIARALMSNPDLLLMDEPTEGLAPLLVREVGRVMGELRAEGLSILLVEQNLPLALSVADRVHILSRGQIVHSSTPAELLASEDVKSRYLGVA